jgi:putative DNA primase/helicase
MSCANDQFKAALLQNVGHAPEYIEPGILMRFATSARHGDTAGYCKLWPDGLGGFYGDFRTGTFGTWSAVERNRLAPSERLRFERQLSQAKAERDALQRDRWARNRARLSKLWASAHTLIPGDPVTDYLKARGLAAASPWPPCLRYHRALPYWHEGAVIGVHPAMLAAFHSASGEVVAIHQTYLTADARKADVPSVKKMSPTAGALTGGSIPLADVHAGVIGVAEGIETALAAGLGSGLPVVAAYSSICLAAYRWHKDVKRLVVFADHDVNGTGQTAANKLAGRAQSAGLAVQVLMPSTPGTDWADVYAHCGMGVGE